jgi:hypothetical protein
MERILPAEVTLANTNYALKSKRLIELCKDLRDMGLVLSFAHPNFHPDSPSRAADYVSLPSIAVIGSQSGALNTDSLYFSVADIQISGEELACGSCERSMSSICKKLE